MARKGRAYKYKSVEVLMTGCSQRKQLINV